MDWQMRLDDAISGPARAMASSLGSLETAFKAVDRAFKMGSIDKMGDGLAKQRAQLRLQVGDARDAARQRAADVRATKASDQAETAASERMASLASGQVGLLLKIASAAAAASAAVVAVGAAFLHATVDAMAFRESALGGLTQVLKSATKAGQVYTTGVDLAVRWNLDPRETITNLQDLVSKGFSAKDAQILLTASADLKVMNPTANVPGILLAIGQIRSKGVLAMEELQGQLGEAGINVGKTLEIIGKKVGKSSAEVRKMITAGKIDSSTGIGAIIESIRQMGGGKLGDVADKASKSIGAMMMGLQFRPGLLGLKLAETLEGSAGEKAVKGALSTLLAATDPSKSDGMKKLVTGLSGLANELLQLVLGPIASAGAGDALQGVLTRAASAVKLVTSAIKSVRPLVQGFFAGFGEGATAVVDVLLSVGKALGFKKDLTGAAGAARMLGKGLAYLLGFAAAAGLVLGALSASAIALAGSMLGGLAGVVAAVGATAGWLSVIPSQLLAAGLDAGNNLARGLVEGIETGVGAVWDAAANLANAAKNAVTTTLDIHSPSRVMADLGAFTASGFSAGVDQGSGQVDASMRDMVTPPVPTVGAGGTSTSLSAGGITVNVYNHGGGPADGGSNTDQIKAAVLEAIEEALARMGTGPEPSAS